MHRCGFKVKLEKICIFSSALQPSFKSGINDLVNYCRSESMARRYIQYLHSALPNLSQSSAEGQFITSIESHVPLKLGSSMSPCTALI